METVRDQFIKIAGEIKTQKKDDNSNIKVEVNRNLRFPREINALLKKKQRLLAHT